MSKQLIKGKAKEHEFASLFPSEDVVFANEHEDKYEHWDLSIKGIGKIDVKGIKVKDENIHFIETISRSGKPGWVFGKADIIAFETINYWILVERKKITDLIKRKSFKAISTENGEILVVPTLTLCFLSLGMLHKTKD